MQPPALIAFALFYFLKSGRDVTVVFLANRGRRGWRSVGSRREVLWLFVTRVSVFMESLAGDSVFVLEEVPSVCSVFFCRCFRPVSALQSSALIVWALPCILELRLAVTRENWCSRMVVYWLSQEGSVALRVRLLFVCLSRGPRTLFRPVILYACAIPDVATARSFPCQLTLIQQVWRCSSPCTVIVMCRCWCCRCCLRYLTP